MSKRDAPTKPMDNPKTDRRRDAFIDGFLTPFRGIAQSKTIPRRRESNGDLASDWRTVGKDMHEAISALKRR